MCWRGHPTDDSVVLVEPMSRLIIPWFSLGYAFMASERLGVSGLPSFVKILSNCKTDNDSKTLKKVIKVVVYLT